ncbi:TPA: LexA family transcriptional regulator, partial [Pasteurella multocida]|nr:LexA family transcriptional regulator [Pasteurella multocida]
FEIKTRLRDIYKAKKNELGLTQAKMALLLGISTQGGVSHYMNPNSKQAISRETILKFASILQVSPTEIDPDFMVGLPPVMGHSLSFGGPIYANLIYKKLISEKCFSKKDNSIKLTLLDNRLSAGDGFFNLDHPDTIRSIEFSPERFMEIFNRRNASNLAMAIIEGNSMFNPDAPDVSLKHGDIAVLDLSINEFKNDGIYAFIFEGQARIKRLQYMSGYRIKVISDNPTYETEILEKEQIEQIKFVGKFFKKIRMDVFDL